MMFRKPNCPQKQYAYINRGVAEKQSDDANAKIQRNGSGLRLSEKG
jgi:hypothetical protein